MRFPTGLKDGLASFQLPKLNWTGSGGMVTTGAEDDTDSPLFSDAAILLGGGRITNIGLTAIIVVINARTIAAKVSLLFISSYPTAPIASVRFGPFCSTDLFL